MKYLGRSASFVCWHKPTPAHDGSEQLANNSFIAIASAFKLKQAAICEIPSLGLYIHDIHGLGPH